MLNDVKLSGNLTKDIELKKTQNGKTYTKFSLAVRRDKDHTDFINCAAWGKTAELIKQYYGHKGNFIIVSNGSLTTSSYEGKNGKVSVTEVLVNNIDFYPSGNKTQRDDSHSPSEPNLLDAPPSVNEFFEGTGVKVEEDIDISSDALPFY